MKRLIIINWVLRGTIFRMLLNKYFKDRLISIFVLLSLVQENAVQVASVTSLAKNFRFLSLEPLGFFPAKDFIIEFLTSF